MINTLRTPTHDIDSVSVIKTWVRVPPDTSIRTFWIYRF